MSSGVVVEERDAVVVIRLDRPEVLNALTVPMLEDVSRALREHATRPLVLTGSGRAFSSGDDLVESEGLDRERFARLIDAFQDVTVAILDSTGPVVAALNGIAVGGAAEIACACDVRVGGPTSDLLLPENGLGLTISNGSSFTLPALAGRRATGLVLLGERIPATRAFELGLIDVLVEGDVLERAVELAGRLGAPGAATDLHLRLLRPPRDAVERALAAERDAALAAWDRGLPQGGIEAYLRSRQG